MTTSSPNTIWLAPPEQLTLPGDEVHIWRASLTRTPSELQSLSSLLAPDETSRAQRIHFERGRASFIVSRGTLRTILAAYLKLNPAQLQFSYSAHGKPVLTDVKGSDGLCFNLSHSHALALYAVSLHREIGVDVEQIRNDFASEGIAGRFFSNAEIAMLRAIPSNERTASFFNCWTLKEAYIKARGEGLSFPLDRFDVSLIPGEQRITLNVHETPFEAARWSLQSLTPGDGYTAAIAVEGHDWNLKYWQA
jgi:4'-phosphopantetheinyl transferase